MGGGIMPVEPIIAGETYTNRQFPQDSDRYIKELTTFAVTPSGANKVAKFCPIELWIVSVMTQ